jgi:hypothetical protein
MALVEEEVDKHCVSPPCTVTEGKEVINATVVDRSIVTAESILVFLYTSLT